MPHSEQCRQLVYYLGQLTQHKFILMQDHKNLSNEKNLELSMLTNAYLTKMETIFNQI